MGHIPKLIHRVWLGGPEPEWTRPFRATWERPGWKVWDWDASTVTNEFPLENQDLWDRARSIAPDHVGQLRADVLRYELLWRYGGVWVDTDLECFSPLDPLIEDADCFAAWEIQDRWIANGLMGATPGHPFIRRLIDGLAANVEREAGYKPNRMTGPQYVTKTYFADPTGVRVLPQRLIYPYGFNDIRRHGPGDVFPGAVCAHHWNNRRRERGVPVAA